MRFVPEKGIAMCLPGTGIGKVADRVDTCLKNYGTKHIVFLSVGENDLGEVFSQRGRQ